MGRTLLWITGGVLVATGMIALYYTFGVAAPEGMAEACGACTGYGVDMAKQLDAVGWDGVADVTLSPSLTMALVGLGLGIPLLVGLNATAWKATGGY